MLPHKLSLTRPWSASTARPKLCEATPNEAPSDDAADRSTDGGESMAYLTAVVLTGALLLGLTLVAASTLP
jgi:hypothetical protein